MFQSSLTFYVPLHSSCNHLTCSVHILMFRVAKLMPFFHCKRIRSVTRQCSSARTYWCFLRWGSVIPTSNSRAGAPPRVGSLATLCCLLGLCCVCKLRTWHEVAARDILRSCIRNASAKYEILWTSWLDYAPTFTCWILFSQMTLMKPSHGDISYIWWECNAVTLFHRVMPIVSYIWCGGNIVTKVCVRYFQSSFSKFVFG